MNVANYGRGGPIQSTKGSGPFLPSGHYPEEPEDIRMLKDPHITHKGDYVEILKQIEMRPTSVNYDSTREENEWDVRRNDVKRIYKEANVRPRVKTPMMDKIVDRGGIFAQPGVGERIAKGMIHGGLFNTTHRFPEVLNKPQGAQTQYNTEQWFEGKYASRPPDVKFSKTNVRAKTAEERAMWKANRPRPLTAEETAELRRLEDLRFPSAAARVPKWDETPRFQPQFKMEGFRKGGIPLSPDYDYKEAWEKHPVKFESSNRFPRDIPPPTALIMRPYDVDVGPKASTAMQVKQSPITYRAAFSPKGGLNIGTSTSGSGGGPGSFVFSGSIEIKNPKSPSLMFMRDVHEPNWFKTPDPQFKVTEFGEDAKYFVFPKAGGRPLNWIRQEQIQDMITTMHPRLARQKYPPKVKIDFSKKKKIK